MFLSFWDYDPSKECYVDVRISDNAPWVSSVSDEKTGFYARYKWEIVGTSVVFTSAVNYINTFGHPAATYYRARCAVAEILDAPRVLREGLYVQDIKWTER